MTVIKATVTRASNGTVDLRPSDPEASDVEVVTLAVPNALDMAKKFVVDTEVEVDVPEGKRKKALVAVETVAEPEPVPAPKKGRKK